jgi:hypothetical protein
MYRPIQRDYARIGFEKRQPRHAIISGFWQNAHIHIVDFPRIDIDINPDRNGVFGKYIGFKSGHRLRRPAGPSTVPSSSVQPFSPALLFRPDCLSG